MVPFSENQEGSFRAAVERWLIHVARSEWQAALAMLDEPNSY